MLEDVERLGKSIDHARKIFDRLSSSLDLDENLKQSVFSAILIRLLIEKDLNEIPQKRKTPLDQFIRRGSFEKHSDQVIGLAYYSFHHEENDTGFNVNGLKKYFYKARWSLPANLNDSVNKLANRKLLVQRGTDKNNLKLWIITEKGDSYVEKKLLKE
jgi:hypothetical protein